MWKSPNPYSSRLVAEVYEKKPSASFGVLEDRIARADKQQLANALYLWRNRYIVVRDNRGEIVTQGRGEKVIKDLGGVDLF